MSWWQQPFFQVALPIIFTFVVATLFQNKRIDDLRDSINKRLDSIEARLGRIETLLVEHDRRLATVEERISPLRR